MQVRQSSIRGDRPWCPAGRDHSVHAHGCYHRYAKTDGLETIRIGRWLCTVCGGTISVLPDDRLPYRPVTVGMVCRYIDYMLCGLSPPEPQVLTVKEGGCLARALQAFNQHIPRLTQALGQILTTITTSAAQLWTQLRRGRNLGAILRFLADEFKTSLLRDYDCLSAWPVRGCIVGFSWPARLPAWKPGSHTTV